MTASPSRLVVPFIALAAFGIALVFAIQHVLWGVPAETKAAMAVSEGSKPALGTTEAALAAAHAKADALATELAILPIRPDSWNGVPAFDVARIEPTGEAVIAGRAPPGSTVELLRNGEVHDRAIADQSGQFVIVPQRLPSGTYDLTLRSKQLDGTQVTSKQSVAVAIEAGSTDRPIAALVTPSKPKAVSSQPAAPAPATGEVAVETVESESGGKLHVSGHARPGAAVKLYLNDSFIASVAAGADGRFAVTINDGVTPGSYRIRLDEVESNSGTVRSRAEVPFNVPDIVAAASVPTQATPSRPAIAAAAQPQLEVAGTTVSPNGGSLSIVVIPKIATTTVSRGDSLWHLSRLSYGAGTRYAVIYEANREQIRNPNMIYPGQIFVVPTQPARQ